MPATLTAPRERDVEAMESQDEKRLDLGIYFKGRQLSQPRYDHILYADTSGSKLGLPKGLDMHPAFLIYDAPRSRIELSVKEREGSQELAEGFGFQRDPSGMPMIQQGHLSNPVFPPCHGTFYGERETANSSIRVPDFRRCTMIWRDHSRIDRSASYVLFVTDRGGLNLRSIPLAIGNLKHTNLIQEQIKNGVYAGSGMNSGGPVRAMTDEAGKTEKPLRFTLQLEAVAGQIRYSVFKYRDDRYMDIAPDPLFNLDPARSYVFKFRAMGDLEFDPDNKTVPMISWYNSVTAQPVKQPTRVRVFGAGKKEFKMKFKALTGQRRLAVQGELPAPRWLTSFFIAGRVPDPDEARRMNSDEPKKMRWIFADPTLVEPEEEDPGP